MREAVGSTFLFKIMIMFILFFTSFLAIAINYSQAFAIKNKAINALEEQEGFNNNSKVIMQSVLTNSGYFRDITCNSANGENITVGGTTVKGICVKKLGSASNRYYKVTTFVNFSLPIVGTFATFPVSGETKIIPHVNED